MFIAVGNFSMFSRISSISGIGIRTIHFYTVSTEKVSF